MKPRSLRMMYLLVMLSGGLFAFVWTYLLMRDVNAFTGKPVFRANLHVSGLLVAIPLYLAFVYFSETGWPLTLAMILGVGITSWLLALVVLLDARLLTLNGRQPNVLDVLSTVGFTVLVGIAFLRIQENMNFLVRTSAAGTRRTT